MDAGGYGRRVGAVGAEGGAYLRAERERYAYELPVADARETAQLESVEPFQTCRRLKRLLKNVRKNPRLALLGGSPRINAGAPTEKCKPRVLTHVFQQPLQPTTGLKRLYAFQLYGLPCVRNRSCAGIC